MLAALLLPPSGDEATIEAIHEQMLRACAELDITLIGGHTEVTHGLERPIVCATMLGEAAKDRLVTSAGARPGDRILITGGLAIEGTAILAREARGALLAAGLPRPTIDVAAGFLDSPGISVVRAARTLCTAVRPRAMHDATEGGLATALREMAEASGAGLLLNLDRVPRLPASDAICGCLGLDPLGLLASGCLIAAVAPEDEMAAVGALQAAGITCASCGEFRPVNDGLALVNGLEGARPLPVFARDELARYLEG
jgi:hydrogenase maturation factor